MTKILEDENKEVLVFFKLMYRKKKKLKYPITTSGTYPQQFITRYYEYIYYWFWQK